MNKLRTSIVALGIFLSPSFVVADTMTLDQVLQRVVDNSLPLQVADLQQQRSGLEQQKLDSMFGWQLGGKSSYNHDVNFIGFPQDTLQITGNINRLLKDGASIGASAGYTYSNPEVAFSPQFPDPSNDGTIDLTYRRPFLKGSGLPSYVQGKKLAQLSEKLSSFSRSMLQEQLANQTIEAYYGLVLAQTQLENTHKAIERTKRLLKYNKKKQELGLSEKKDILQVDAQLKAREAELESLKVLRTRLTVTLNQLMNREAEKSFTAVMDDKVISGNKDFDELYKSGLEWSPNIKLQNTKVEVAEAQIELKRDSLKDTLNGFASVGGREKYGEPAQGSTVNEQDYAFSFGIEYQKSLDRSDVNAEISQAKLDRVIAQREIENVKRNLKYGLNSLLQDIDTTDATIKAMKVRYDQEQAKLDEAETRYRRGRADTFELITYENDISMAEFLLEQQKIELSKKYSKLDVTSGQVWKRVIPLQQQ